MIEASGTNSFQDDKTTTEEIMSRLIRKSRETESAALSVKKFFQQVIHYILCVYIILILGVLPFYQEEGYSHIGTDKSTFFNQVSVMAGRLLFPLLLCYLAASLIECLQRGRAKKNETEQEGEGFWKGLKKSLSLTDGFALLYGIVLLVSYACSRYRDTALWGEDWWFMGLYPQLALLCIYFFLSRLWNPRKELFFLVFPVSGVVFLLGFLNRFGIYPLDMQVKNVQFISTIGNINWYCGYLVSVFFGGVFLLWQQAAQKPWQRALFGAYVAAGFATLATQGSSSGIVSLAAVVLVLLWLSAPKGERMQQLWLILLLFSAVCLIIFCIRRIFPESMTYSDTVSELLTGSPLPIVMTAVSALAYLGIVWIRKKKDYPERLAVGLARGLCIGILLLAVVLTLLLCVNTLYPGCIGPLSQISAFTFSPAWGSNRGATWKAGLMCFLEQDFLHRLIGVGPDCMAAYLYGNGSEELLSLVRERFGEARLTNAHNEWLTVLVNTGVAGAAAYVGMIVSAIVRYIRQRDRNYITAAAGFCLLAYTVNNMFSFQQAMNVSTMFVIFGIGEAYQRRKENVS